MTRELPRVSANTIHKWRPCWHDDDIQRVLDRYEDEPWSALDVLSSTTLRGVTCGDRLWVVLRPELVPTRVLVRFAQDCADRAVRVYAASALRSAADAQLDDSRGERLRAAAERCAKEGTAAAAKAAGYAASATRVAEPAAWVASAATRDAARAVEAAARAATLAAEPVAWAARDAARAVEAAARAATLAARGACAAKQWQVRHLRKLLKAYERGE